MTIQNVCQGICKIHEKYKLCVGCYRSRLEIARWNKMTDEEKSKLVVTLQERKETFSETNF